MEPMPGGRLESREVWTAPDLRGKVAVVAGATRGAGRGIATALGEAGATVYCTGRSVRGRPASGHRPETIDETAEIVTAHGGKGIPAQVDHTVEAEVEALFQCVKAEQGRLDLLVNDVWGGDELTEFGTPLWEVSLPKGRLMLERAVYSHIVTSRFAAPLLIETGRGLIVEITDGDSFTYRGNIFYDLVKTSVIRLAFIQARELRSRGTTSLALTPGFLRSEAMLDRFEVSEANWRDGAAKDPHFIASETPLFVGRAVAALAGDHEVAKKSGRVFSSWGLSREYGFTDADGSRPDWGAYFLSQFGKTHQECDAAFYAYWSGGPVDAVWGDWP
jgi:NAD(P)-dependent dehydrogenase (short-subunit alcohol dehydrogenase family)